MWEKDKREKAEKTSDLKIWFFAVKFAPVIAFSYHNEHFFRLQSQKIPFE